VTLRTNCAVFWTQYETMKKYLEGNKKPGECTIAGLFLYGSAISFQSYTVKVSKRVLRSHELNDLR